jgi:hypothetical protein
LLQQRYFNSKNFTDFSAADLARPAAMCTMTPSASNIATANNPCIRKILLSPRAALTAAINQPVGVAGGAALP